MTSSDRNTTMRSNDPMESLLRQASPRPVPTTADEVSVRDAVQAEWKTITRRRRIRKQLGGFALAATVLLAVFASLDSFRVSGVAEVQVASITKSFGSIYLLGERAELHETSNLLTMSAGQTIHTGAESGIGLDWTNGGSLRLDENTRVMFNNATEITLLSGRVYFDSVPFDSGTKTSADSGAGFQIRTDYGVVTHHGTQYMADARPSVTRSGRPDGLSVSVREGQVSISGGHYDEMVSSGRRVHFAGSRRPSVVNINRFGEDWSWVEKMSAPIEFDSRTVHELLVWASRETGLQLHFENDAVEQDARGGKLSGDIPAAGPMSALRLWMMTVDLHYRIENGVIYISKSKTEKASLPSP